MSTPALPLKDIVDVVVLISPQAPAQPTFNQGLILGSSGVIPSVGANSRIRKYSTLAQIAADGFALDDPEYIAASLYFGQSPAAQYVHIGCQDPGGLNGVSVSSGGTGYTVDDLITVVKSGGSGGTVRVKTAAGGVVSAIDLVKSGTGYSAGAATTTGGTGTGLALTIDTVGEPAVQAAIACREIDSSWYMFVCTSTLADADIEALAAWAQTASPPAVFFYNTSDADVLGNVADNVADNLKTLKYGRVFGLYSTTQSDTFPNNAYAAAAVMGVAAGLNTGLNGSAYTLKFKQLVGVAPEPLTPSQISTLEGLNVNLYLGYANAFTLLEQGVMANGQFFDEIICLDMLVSAIQINVMNRLMSTPKVPQTDPGETLLLSAVNQACETARQIGFVAGGTWKGPQVLNLNTGDALPQGYLAQAESYKIQLQSDREARKAMPIYVAIIEAGAVHSILIGVYVER